MLVRFAHLAVTHAFAALRLLPLTGLKQVTEFVAVPLGRQVRPEWFVRVEFADGSAFNFRDL